MADLYYVQSTGQLFRLTSTGLVFLGTGYSGNGEGLNNPAMQGVKNVGPIPIGLYIVGAAEDRASTGPRSMQLVPDLLTRVRIANMGRDPLAFYMHGDTVERDHSASHGCIVADHDIRLNVSLLRRPVTLEVVALPVEVPGNAPQT